MPRPAAPTLPAPLNRFSHQLAPKKVWNCCLCVSEGCQPPQYCTYDLLQPKLLIKGIGIAFARSSGLQLVIVSPAHLPAMLLVSISHIWIKFFILLWGGTKWQGAPQLTVVCDFPMLIVYSLSLILYPSFCSFFYCFLFFSRSWI